MRNNPDNSQSLLVFATMAGLFLASVGYGKLLNTAKGKQFSQDHTWASVVVGVLLTLFWLSVADPKAARKAGRYFAISGIPMIARSLINKGK